MLMIMLNNTNTKNNNQKNENMKKIYKNRIPKIIFKQQEYIQEYKNIKNTKNILSKYASIFQVSSIG